MSDKAIVKEMIDASNGRGFLALNRYRLAIKFTIKTGRLAEKFDTQRMKRLQRVKGVAKCYIRRKRGCVIIKIILSKKFKY